MAVDRDGNTITPGQVYGLAGTVRRVDGETISIVVGMDGYEATVRVAAADVLPVGTVSGGPFMPVDASLNFSAAPKSNVAAAVPLDLVRLAEVDALFAGLTAAFLGYLAGKAPLSHSHVGSAVTLASATWSGALLGSGVKNCQDLANWIDANVGGP